MRSGGSLLSRELHPIAPLLDSLTSALNKVYQRKGVNITLDISPEISFVGEKNDFMEVMGNVLDNACKYCLEFVEVSVRQTNDNHLHILVEDDGPGIPAAMRSAVFDRGQRADTLRPGQGVGLSVARDIVAQYDGRILAEESLLGGACMEVILVARHWKIKRAKTVGFLTAPCIMLVPPSVIIPNRHLLWNINMDYQLTLNWPDFIERYWQKRRWC